MPTPQELTEFGTIVAGEISRRLPDLGLELLHFGVFEDDTPGEVILVGEDQKFIIRGEVVHPITREHNMFDCKLSGIGSGTTPEDVHPLVITVMGAMVKAFYPDRFESFMAEYRRQTGQADV